MRKTEDHHHSPEQVQGYVEQAREIATALDLNFGERAALLPTLVTLLSSKQVFYEQVAPTGVLLGQNHLGR